MCCPNCKRKFQNNVCKKIEQLMSDGPHRIRVWTTNSNEIDIVPLGLLDIDDEDDNGHYVVYVPHLDQEFHPYWDSDTTTIGLTSDTDQIDFEFVESDKADERYEIERELTTRWFELLEQIAELEQEDSDEEDSDEDIFDADDDTDEDEDESEDVNDGRDQYLMIPVSEPYAELKILDETELGIPNLKIQEPKTQEPSIEAKRIITRLIPELFGEAIGSKIIVMDDDVPIGTGRLIEYENVISAYVSWNGLRALKYPNGSTIPLYYNWEGATFNLSLELENEEYTDDFDFVFEDPKYCPLQAANDSFAKAVISRTDGGDCDYYFAKSVASYISYVEMRNHNQTTFNPLNASTGINVGIDDARELLELFGAMYMIILLMWVTPVSNTHTIPTSRTLADHF